MVKNFKYINNLILLQLFILISIFKINNCAIYLPFKLIESNTKNSLADTSLIMRNWNKTLISSQLSIGTPSQKLEVFFSSDIYELNLFENMCDKSNSFFYKEKSSTYNYIKNIKYSYNKIMNCSIINESIILFTDSAQKNSIIIDGFNIIYSDNKKEDFKPNGQNEYEYLPNTCLNIGFRPSQSISFGYDLNFVGQIKHHKKNGKSIIKDYDFTFKFTNNNQGFLIIGEKPHEFDQNNFDEEQYFSIGSKNNKYTSEWFLEFDNILYTGIGMNDNKAYNRGFYSDLSVKFDLNSALILGNKNYEICIKVDFFNSLMEKNICFEDIDGEYKFFYCDKKQSINYIEKYFPVLKFCIKQIGFCFNFDYKDLFKEKDDKMYFLVYFNLKDNSFSSRFVLGQILIKKYILTFNYDTKLIGFYNGTKIIGTNIQKEKDGAKGGSSNSTTIIIFIISFIVFISIGFLLGKKIYERARKKKANELNDDYEYESHDINSKSKSNYLNLEMNSKYDQIN